MAGLVIDVSRVTNSGIHSHENLLVARRSISLLRYIYTYSKSWRKDIHKAIISCGSNESPVFRGVLAFFGGSPGLLHPGAFVVIEPEMAATSSVSAKSRSSGSSSAASNAAITSFGSGADEIVTGLCRQHSLSGVISSIDPRSGSSCSRKRPISLPTVTTMSLSVPPPAPGRQRCSRWPWQNCLRGTCPGGTTNTISTVECAAMSVSKGQKVVYLAPNKALCDERQSDWSTRLVDIDPSIACTTITGDAKRILVLCRNCTGNLILMTPEKCDSITQRWIDQFVLLSSIKLMLVDEVHMIGETERGGCLESVICRMKTIQRAEGGMF